jgi:hypothetical protein
MANKEVEFHEAASEEFEAAFDWYWERSAGAAARFAGEVSRARSPALLRLRSVGQLGFTARESSFCGDFHLR